jgi:hypothetical protein
MRPRARCENVREEKGFILSEKRVGAGKKSVPMEQQANPGRNKWGPRGGLLHQYEGVTVEQEHRDE